MTFLEFVNNRNSNENNLEQLTEAIKLDDYKKYSKLISSIIRKETGKTFYMYDLAEFERNGKTYYSTCYVVQGKGTSFDMMVSFDYLKSEASLYPESISFFNKEETSKWMWSNDGELSIESSLSIYVMGASLVYFLPVVSYVVKTGDFNLDNKEIRKIASNTANTYGKADTKTSEGLVATFQFGKLKYNIFNEDFLKYQNECSEVMTEANINNQNISDMIREANDDAKNSELGIRKKKAMDTMRSASAAGDFETAKLARKEYNMLLAAMKEGLRTNAEFEAWCAKREKNKVVTRKSVQKVVDKFKEEVKKEMKDPEEAFKEMRGYLSMVVSGLQPGLIVCGAPGVGKTYRVTKFLRSKGYDDERGNLHIIKGRCTTRNLYLDLYNYKDKGDIILIDDADSLIGPKAPEDTINLLKAALDSNEDNGRLVSYRVGGRLVDNEGVEVPKSFKYKGSVIVLTNYNVGNLDTALKGRCFTQDLAFSTNQLLNLIKKIMPELGEGMVSSASKIKAFDYLSELSEKGSQMEVSIRSFMTCAKLYQMGQDNPDFTEEDIRAMIKDQVEHQAMRGGKKY